MSEACEQGISINQNIVTILPPLLPTTNNFCKVAEDLKSSYLPENGVVKKIEIIKLKILIYRLFVLQ
jgi:hypothetical protein